MACFINSVATKSGKIGWKIENCIEGQETRVKTVCQLNVNRKCVLLFYGSCCMI